MVSGVYQLHDLFIVAVQKLPPPPIMFPPHRRGRYSIMSCYCVISSLCVMLTALCVYVCVQLLMCDPVISCVLTDSGAPTDY